MRTPPEKGSSSADWFIIGGLTVASFAIAFWILKEGAAQKTPEQNLRQYKPLSRTRLSSVSPLKKNIEFRLLDHLQRPLTRNFCNISEYLSGLSLGESRSLRAFSTNHASAYMYSHSEAFHRCENKIKPADNLLLDSAKPQAFDSYTHINTGTQKAAKLSSEKLLSQCFTIEQQNMTQALIEITFQIRDRKAHKAIRCSEIWSDQWGRDKDLNEVDVIVYYTLYWNEKDTKGIKAHRAEKATGGIVKTMSVDFKGQKGQPTLSTAFETDFF